MYPKLRRQNNNGRRPVRSTGPWRPPTLGLPWLVAFLAIAAIAPPVQAQDGYLDFDGLTDALETIADASDQATLRSIGTSWEGRDVWLVEVSAAGPMDPPERPAVLVVGNLSGDHLVGSQLALEMIRHLVEGGADVDAALTDHVFYFVPRLNPDGAEARFTDVLSDDRRNRRPFDDDNDGRTDEDPGEDLNGDGLITVMRVPDALGAFVIDADDDRLLAEAAPAAGRAGAYAVYWEGTDSDGDGYYNEDGLGGVDLDRNFQHVYPYYTADAGPNMVSEPEARALMDFVISHRNVAAILTFGHSDNLIEPPGDDDGLGGGTPLALPGFADRSNEGVFDVGVYDAFSPLGALDLRGTQPGADNDPESGRRPEENVNEDDLEYFEAVSESYRGATGIEEAGVGREPEGAFFQYGYFQFGVPSFSTPGWGLPPVEGEADEEAEDDDGSVLDALAGAGLDPFVAWEPFDHPDLGEVEIGGVRPYATTNPTGDGLEELGRAHGEFLVALSDMLPRVRIADAEVEAHGGGIYTVSVEVVNDGLFPSALRHGVVSGAVDPVTVRIGVSREDLVTGDALSSTIDRLEGSGTRERFSWVVRGSEGQSVEVRVRSDKGGTDAVNVTLEGA